VAGCRAGEVGDFAFDPDVAEHVFEQHPCAAVELADGQDFTVQASLAKGSLIMGRMIKAFGDQSL
jgi:NOL1/NOP2/fmu family ribosome biogenesis protein